MRTWSCVFHQCWCLVHAKCVETSQELQGPVETTHDWSSEKMIQQKLHDVEE